MGWIEDELVGPGHTPCFTLTRHTVTTSCTIPLEKRLHIGVGISGTGTISTETQTIAVRPGSRILLPAQTQNITVQPDGSPLNLVWCHEGKFLQLVVSESAVLARSPVASKTRLRDRFRI